MFRTVVTRLLVLGMILCRPIHAEETPDPAPEWKAPFATQNVILLVIDGPRWSETFGDSEHKYVPHLANDIAKEGVIYTHFKNNGHTVTTPGHIALTSGFYQDADNTGKELPKEPTILQRFLKSSGLPAKSVSLVTSKDKLEVLKNCSNAEWKDKWQCSSNCGLRGLNSENRLDTQTFEIMKTTLAQDHPRLAVFHFMGPDIAGHAKLWDEYLKSITETDKMAWELWQQIQKDPFYAGKTAFIISNDHGRHPDGLYDGFISHGDDCPGCKHILLYATGPDFKKNVVLDTPGEQLDVAVTIAHLLGFKIPESKGRVLNEMLLEAALPKK